MAFTIEMTTRGVLLAGHWKTTEQLNHMSSEDKRNTLIVVLSDNTNQNVGYFQGLDTESLIGKGAVIAFLKETWIHDVNKLKEMTDDNQRNTLIVLNNNHTDIEVSKLQGMSNKENVQIGLQWYTESKTIAAILEFYWNIDHAKVFNNAPDIIATENYDNRESSEPLKTKFTFSREISNRSSFSEEHGFEVKIGVSTTFTAGIPKIAANETTVNIDTSTNHKWQLGEENTTTQRYSRESDVTVPPGKYIQRTASVTRGSLDVPYRAKIRAGDGTIQWIEGTWNGVSTVNLVEKQVDIKG